MTTAKYFVVMALRGNPAIKKEAYFASVRVMDAWTDSLRLKGYELYCCQTVSVAA
jgi:hypothetical protein